MQTTPTHSLSVWLSFEVMVVENVVLAFTLVKVPLVAMISLAKILSMPFDASANQAMSFTLNASARLSAPGGRIAPPRSAVRYKRARMALIENDVITIAAIRACVPIFSSRGACISNSDRAPRASASDYKGGLWRCRADADVAARNQ